MKRKMLKKVTDYNSLLNTQIFIQLTFRWMVAAVTTTMVAAATTAAAAVFWRRSRIVMYWRGFRNMMARRGGTFRTMMTGGITRAMMTWRRRWRRRWWRRRGTLRNMSSGTMVTRRTFWTMMCSWRHFRGHFTIHFLARGSCCCGVSCCTCHCTGPRWLWKSYFCYRDF